VLKEITGLIFQEIKKDVWDAVCITTNGNIKKNGKAVMGKGVANGFRMNFPGIDKVLASELEKFGNRLNYLGMWRFHNHPIRIFSFPTKHNWWEKSNLKLIVKSAKELQVIANHYDYKILLPRPGCNNGGLYWEEVKTAISFLNDNITIITKE
jgi:hypothetical protein